MPDDEVLRKGLFRQVPGRSVHCLPQWDESRQSASARSPPRIQPRESTDEFASLAARQLTLPSAGFIQDDPDLIWRRACGVGSFDDGDYCRVDEEVIGNYDRENPRTGHGLACWKNAAVATGIILDWLDVAPDASTILFHREDPLTSKT